MNTDEQALIAALVIAFLLTHSEVAAMATLIFTARLDSAKASYQQASDTVGASTSWETSGDVQGQLKDSSEQDAQSIASTYQDDLTAVATAFVAGWMLDHETLAGCEQAARESLSIWAQQRAEWKSEQIAFYTCASGANTGTNAWIDDLSADEIDLPEGMSADDVEVVVLPETAICSLCKEVAGQSFDIDEIDTIDEFPIHIGCDHRKIIQMRER